MQCLACAVVAIVLGSEPDDSIVPPEGWVLIDVGRFRFHVPPDIKATPSRGIDSFTREYKGKSVSFHFDYGDWSDPLRYSNEADYEAHEGHIDGKRSKIASFRYPEDSQPFPFVIGVHFPDVNGFGTKLTVFALCKTKADYEIARSIFRTIKFR